MVKWSMVEAYMIRGTVLEGLLVSSAMLEARQQLRVKQRDLLSRTVDRRHSERDAGEDHPREAMRPFLPGAKVEILGVSATSGQQQ